MKKSTIKQFKKTYTLEINDIKSFYDLLFENSDEKIYYSVGFDGELYTDFKDIEEVIEFIREKGVRGLISIKIENSLINFSIDHSEICFVLQGMDEKEVNHIIREFEGSLKYKGNCNFVLVSSLGKFLIGSVFYILLLALIIKFFVRNLFEILGEYSMLFLLLTIFIFSLIFAPLVDTLFKRIVFKDGNKKNSFTLGWGLILGFISIVGFIITILRVF